MSFRKVFLRLLAVSATLVSFSVSAQDFELEIFEPSGSLASGPFSFNLYFYTEVDPASFNDPVTDLVITTTGTVVAGTAIITESAGNPGYDFLVEIPTFTGDGTFQLTIPAGAAVSVSNASDANLEVSSDVFTIDNMAPSLTVGPLSRTLVTAGDLSPITFDVTPVDADFASLAVTDVVLTAGGDAAALVDLDTLFGKAMAFSGAATRPDPLDEDFGLTGAFTMEAWVLPDDSNPTGGVIIGKGFPGFGLMLEEIGGNLVPSCIIGGGGAVSTIAISLDRWVHVACTFDGTNTARLYVDGDVVASEYASAPFYESGNPLTIGTGGLLFNPFGAFPGAIDELRLWTVERTQIQIADNLGMTITTPQVDLYGYWQFDQFEDLAEGAAGVNDIRDFSSNDWHLDTAGVSVTAANPFFGATITLSDFSGNGTLDIDLPAGIAGDEAGNGSAAVTVPETITVATSGTPPQVLSITPDIAGPTNADSFVYRVVFNEDVSGFTVGDLVVTLPTNRTIDTLTLAPISGTEYDATVQLLSSVAGDGDLVLTVPAGAVQADSSGLSNATPLSSAPVRVDTVKPIPLIGSATSSPRDDSPFQLDIVFDEAVTGFDASDITVINATLGVVTGSDAIYAVSVTPTITNGTVTIGSIPAFAATDLAGNLSSPGQTGALLIVIDTSLPVLTSPDLPTVTGATFTRRLSFSEPVTGLTLGDLSITNTTGTAAGTLDTVTAVAAASPCSEDQCYDLEVINVAGEGEIEVTLAADSVLDATGLPNNEQSLTQAIDTILPVLLSTEVDDSLAGVGQLVSFIINASEAVTLDQTKIGLATTDTATATLDFVSSGETVTVRYRETAGTGTLQLNIGAGALVDAAGNRSTNAALQTPIITLDGTIPDLVSFGPVIGGVQIFPGSVLFEGVLSKPVTEFNGINFLAEATDLGSLPLNKVSTPTLVAPDLFQVSVDISDLPTGETFDLWIDATFISLRDAAGNYRQINNALSTSAQIDLVLGPAPALFTDPMLTNQSPIPVDVVFPGDVTGLDATAALYNNGTFASLTGSGSTYTLNVTPDSEGFVTIQIREGAAIDSQGRKNAASEPLINLEYDSTPPVISNITSNTGGSVGYFAFNLLVTVSEPVAIPTLESVLAAGLVSPPLAYNVEHLPAQSSPGTLVFRASPVGDPANGTLDFTIAAGAVSDLAGNPTIAPTSLDAPITVDGGGPSVTTQSMSFVDGGNPIDPLVELTYNVISASELTLDFDFGETVSGLDIDDITITKPGSLTYTGRAFELAGDSGGSLTVQGIAGEGQLTLGLDASAVLDGSSNPNQAQTLLEQNISNIKLEVVEITGGPEVFTVAFNRPVGDFESSGFTAEFVAGQSVDVTVTRANLSFTDLVVTIPESVSLVGDFNIVVSAGAATDDGYGNSNPDEFIGPLTRRDTPILVGPFLVSGIDDTDEFGVHHGSRMILNQAFALNGSLEIFGNQLLIKGQFSALMTPEQVLWDSTALALVLDLDTNVFPFVGGSMSFEVFGDEWSACTAELIDSAKAIKFSGGALFGGEYLQDVRLDSREARPIIMPGNDYYAIGESQACAGNGIDFTLHSVEQLPEGDFLELEILRDLESETGDLASFSLRDRFERINDQLLVQAEASPLELNFSGIPWTVQGNINPSSGVISIGDLTYTDGASQFTLVAPALLPFGVEDRDNTLTFGPDIFARFPRRIDFLTEVRTFETEILTMFNPVYEPGELSSDESIPLDLPGHGINFNKEYDQPITTANFRIDSGGILLPNEHHLLIGGSYNFNDDPSHPWFGYSTEIEAEPAVFRSPGGASITHESYESAVGFLETDLGDFEYTDIKLFFAHRESEGTLLKKPDPSDGQTEIDMPFRIWSIYGDSIEYEQCMLLTSDPVALFVDDEGNPMPICGPGTLGAGPITPQSSVGKVFCFFNLPPGMVGFTIPGFDAVDRDSKDVTVRLNPGCGKLDSVDPLNVEFDMTLIIPTGAPSLLTLDGSIRVENDVIDKIQAGFSGFDLPVGNSGLYWTGIDIGLDNLGQTKYIERINYNTYPPEDERFPRPVTFIGRATFAGGPDLYIARVLAGTVTTQIDKFRIKMWGDMRLLDPDYGPVFGEAKAKFNYAGGNPKRFSGDAEAVIYAGLADAKADFNIGEHDGTGSITTSASIPKAVPVVGGMTIGELTLGMAINRKANGDPAVSIKGKAEVLGIRVTVEITSTGGLYIHTANPMAIDTAGGALRNWENSTTYRAATNVASRNAQVDDELGYEVLANFSQGLKRYGSGAAVPSNITLSSASPTLVRLSWQNDGVAPDYVITGPGGFTWQPGNVERNLNVAAEVGYLENLEGRDATYVFSAPTPGSYVVEVANAGELGEYAVEVLVQNVEPLFEFVNVVSDGTGLFLEWAASDQEDPATVTFYLDSNRRDFDGEPLTGPFVVGVDSSTALDLASQPRPPGSYWVYALVDDGFNAPVYVYAAQPVVIVNPDSPPAIRGIEAVAGGTSVVVEWEASSLPNIAGYSVLWTTDLGGTDFEDSVFVPSGRTRTMIPDLLPHTRYKFTVTASIPSPADIAESESSGLNADGLAEKEESPPLTDQLALLSASMDSQLTVPSDNLQAWLSGALVVEGGAAPPSGPVFNESLVVEVDIVETGVPFGENNLPEFVSVPDRGIDFNGSYQYAVQTRDRDGENIVLQLVEGPTGMVLNGTTVVWSPNGLQGAFPVVLEASDGKGTSSQTWTLTSAAVLPDRLRIVGEEPNDIAPGVQFTFDVPVAGGCGSEVTYNLLQAPVGMTISAAGRIDWLAAGDNAIVVVTASQICDEQVVEATREYAIDIEAPNGDLDDFLTIPATCDNSPSATVSGNSQIEAGEEAQVRIDLTGTAPWTLAWSDGLVEANVQDPTVLRTVQPTETTTYSLLGFYDTVCGGEASGAATVSVKEAPLFRNGFEG